MLKLYNSLTKKVQEFKSIHPLQVGMYTCGPTVYQFAHIGNFRAYTTADILVRVLQFNGYDVKFVMNVTDVGHLVSDADTGEDKLEKSAKKEGKDVWELARFYTDAFLKDYHALNLTKPAVLCKATDHIKEQIDLIKRLEEKGFTYKISDGIYFDTSKFPTYGELSSLDQIKEGARVDINHEKKNPRDFALWKFSVNYISSSDSSNEQLYGNRQMEWWFEGPFAGQLFKQDEWRALDNMVKKGKMSETDREEIRKTIGFPGWHIECSAMSMEYLGESFDIHTGGIDHKEIHHPNEIAQSEAATGKKFVNYWIHTAFMQVNGQKMSKSLNNTYTLYDLEKEGYDILALRYLYLQTHYRQEMNFTYDALDAAQNAYKKLVVDISRFEEPSESHGRVPAGVFEDFEKRFLDALNEDLNTSKALAVLWEVVKSPYPSGPKLRTIFKMDRVLGLNLQELSHQLKNVQQILPGHVQQMVEERQHLRKLRKFNAADQIRAKIEKLGYELEDTKKGPKVTKK